MNGRATLPSFPRTAIAINHEEFTRNIVEVYVTEDQCELCSKLWLECMTISISMKIAFFPITLCVLVRLKCRGLADFEEWSIQRRAGFRAEQFIFDTLTRKRALELLNESTELALATLYQ